MHIIVIGGSTVGKELSKKLVRKRQSVILIEKDKEKARELEKSFNIPVLEGNGANIADLKKAKVKCAQMLIAVTENDAVNVISCMLAKHLSIPRTVARVLQPETIGAGYSYGLTKWQLGLDFIINPKKALAQEMAKLILFPYAGEIEHFAKGEITMAEIEVTDKAKINNQFVKDINLPDDCTVMGVKRPNGSLVIPKKKDKIYQDDKVYIAGNTKSIEDASWQINKKTPGYSRIVIIGGGMTGFHLAKILESHPKHNYIITIIEKNHNTCCFLKRNLIKSIVLESSYFNEEEIAEADIVITITDNDETNIIVSIMAGKNNVKAFAGLNKIEYEKVYSAVGIKNRVNPHLITIAQILRFARKEDVVSLAIMQNANAQAMEFILSESSLVADKKISELNFPKSLKIGPIIRDKKVIIPTTNTLLKPNDRVVILAPSSLSDYEINKFLIK